MRARKLKTVAFLLLFTYIFGALSIGAFAFSSDECQDAFKLNGDTEISSRFFEFFEKSNGNKTKKLAVGGDVFGIKIDELGLSVTDAKKNSSFQAGDRILKLGEVTLNSIKTLEDILDSCGGKPLNFEILRDGEKMKISVTPRLEDGEYKLGINLREIAQGIGTVTYIDPDNMSFAGLGHGVLDSGGNLIPIEDGTTTKVILGGIKKGECGKPGELSGVLGKSATGEIYSNTECGIFGYFEGVSLESLELYEIGKKSELTLGEAEIISSVKNSGRAKYKIEITEIDEDSTGSKSFKIKVTDDSLIALTGGIVRGMSGSPIIQNGKLVGAVTHVLVANPTEGYGIFIENMLNAGHTARNELPAA